MARHFRTPPPRAHWLLLATLLGAIAGLLALNSLLAGGLGAEGARAPGPAAKVPAAVRTGGPIIDPRRDPPATLRPPDRTIALTFDDGPDPQWTPAILDVLARHDVHATFFVTGAHAAEHPGLVERILAAGHEVGHHTATHTDLSTAGPLRTWLELRSTDLVLAYAAGVSTSLIRPPYSATPDAVDDAAWAAAQRLGDSGRLVVLSNVDSTDWRRPGVDEIIARSTPPDDLGAVLLMHDGGGDRAQTVAALDKLLPTLKADGWRIGTVTGTVGARGTQGESSALEWLGGALLVGAIQLAEATADTLQVLLIVATGLAALRTLLVLITAWVHVRRTRRSPRPSVRAPVTVIVPAYNEAAGIEATVRSILASRHPVEVIVVDDGSTDRTARIVASLRLPRVRLIRQANAGKAAALNTGLAAARTNLVMMVDGDTVLEPHTVGRLAAHFTDPAVGAVSGNAKVANRRGLLGRWQHIEYVIGFNLDRRMYDVLGCMPTVPGAVGAFRRSAVLAVGGVGGDTLAEDTDLTMALERAGWRVTYEERAVAWTEAPATLGQLWKQRYRWCYGTLQAVWKHRRAVLERGPAGHLGRRGLPYLLLFQVALPVLAPVVDVAAVYALLTGNSVATTLTWLAFLVLQAIPGIVAFRLDGERLGPLLALPLQQLVYRQLMYLVVVQSLATALSGVRLPWQKLERHGTAVAHRA
ncbi:MAG TPA: bifunctional polysaccharide deacetylase/glycosyltransferase family 2 protein [Actinophytocola sp.]|uniref:bifunctional polysaccharide deacetylase/glycosyltransferase family 2 protein n=1 Tax=Actinophytocola sp. TaxID=1872138 RepID=UPI002DDD8391|nr:bifunctional polysaccharide deacetylase/glycosyltransferase family 2 protein [Actinophytocola sp.]HEV2783124.1 bifunctional polysaccharide deacetylase/glycosyltransferase family 2 protein [Actinophytocola sp.]